MRTVFWYFQNALFVEIYLEPDQKRPLGPYLRANTLQVTVKTAFGRQGEGTRRRGAVTKTTDSS